VDKDEIKHFIIMLHDGEIKSNAKKGLESLEEGLGAVKDGRYNYKHLFTLNRNFPHLLYPCFRLQSSMMRKSWGERWWGKKIFMLQLEAMDKRLAMESNLGKNKDGKLNDAQKEREELKVKSEMGVIKYHIMPWKREPVRKKLRKLAMLEEELRRREEEDAKEEQVE
jgi:hypothetical protein